jgi:DNA-binding NarL/FixJ family response regulator
VIVVPGVRSVDGDAAAHPDGGARLLLIDRHPLFLSALASLLTPPPVLARIEFAQDTETGLAIALRGGIQLVFCDARSEPIPAIELAERLAGADPAVPVIVLGDPEDERLLLSALHSKVAGVFTKDAVLDEFLVGVRAVLSGHRAIGSNLMAAMLVRLTENAQPGRRPPSQLSPTELDILTMIGEAKSVPVIAAARGISNKTVRNHLANIYRKLQLRSRTEAMLCAARMGLVSN